MSLGQWSTTAANNATADPAINWQEGQAPSTVNDSARAMMAALATWFQAAEWLNYALTPTYVSGTQFTVAGNQTAIYSVGRRVRTFNTGGTLYGTITASAYTTLTTVTVAMDSGSMDSGLSEVDVGIVTPGKSLMPGLIGVQKFTASGTYTPSAGANKALIVAIGGGGGGGAAGLSSGSGSAASAGSGGGAGAFAMAFQASGLVSQTVTIGAGGSGGSTGGSPAASGSAGGQTSFGSLVVCPGGSGGQGGGIQTSGVGFGSPSASSAAPSGSLTPLVSSSGQGGGPIIVQPGQAMAGAGGSNPFGMGAQGAYQSVAGFSNGSAALGAGAGGAGGAWCAVSSTIGQGGTGGTGLVLVFEFA